MNTTLKTASLLTTLALLLAACGDLPLPGMGASNGTSTGGTSTGGTSTGGDSTGGTSTAPTPDPTLLITGKTATAGDLTYRGGGPVTLSVQDLPEGTTVRWTSSQGDLAETGSGTATFPYSPANRLALDGSTDTIVTATLTGKTGTTTLRQALRLDDQAPLAQGGVSVTVKGKTGYLGSGNTYLPSGATFNVSYADTGVGLSKAVLSAYRNGAPVMDHVMSTTQLSEAGGYTLQSTPIADLLGNQVGGDAVLGGSFAVDFTGPLVTADRAQGAAIQSPASVSSGTSTGGTSTGGTSTGGTSSAGALSDLQVDDALTFTVSDPALADGTAGSGVKTLTISPAGTVSEATASVTWQQLRTAGVKGSAATVTVTATDSAGNTTTFAQRVTLPSP